MVVHSTVDIQHDHVAERLGHVLHGRVHVLLNVLQSSIKLGVFSFIFSSKVALYVLFYLIFSAIFLCVSGLNRLADSSGSANRLWFLDNLLISCILLAKKFHKLFCRKLFGLCLEAVYDEWVVWLQFSRRPKKSNLYIRLKQIFRDIFCECSYMILFFFIEKYSGSILTVWCTFFFIPSHSYKSCLIWIFFWRMHDIYSMRFE